MRCGMIRATHVTPHSVVPILYLYSAECTVPAVSKGGIAGRRRDNYASGVRVRNTIPWGSTSLAV